MTAETDRATLLTEIKQAIRGERAGDQEGEMISVTYALELIDGFMEAGTA